MATFDDDESLHLREEGVLDNVQFHGGSLCSLDHLASVQGTVTASQRWVLVLFDSLACKSMSGARQTGRHEQDVVRVRAAVQPLRRGTALSTPPGTHGLMCERSSATPSLPAQGTDRTSTLPGAPLSPGAMAPHCKWRPHTNLRRAGGEARRPTLPLGADEGPFGGYAEPAQKPKLQGR